MIKLPRKVTTWVQGADFGRQVFQFSADVFDTLRSLRSAVQELQDNPVSADGATPGAHASTHLPVSGSDPLTVGSTADSFCVGNDSRLSDDRTASGLRTASSVVSISAATAPSAGQILVASSSTSAAWRGTTSFSFTAGAATLDVSSSLHFAASAGLSQDSAITLSNGANGRSGRIYVLQDSTGGWDLTFTAAGRTLLLEENAEDTSPGGAAGAATVYDYDFQTIDGTDYLVIRRTLLGGGTFLLDGLTVDALFALSVWRKLSVAYDGPAITVRRSGDDSEKDIYFTALGVLDEDTLMAFAGSASLFVKTIYDQSGNGRHFTNSTTTAQPRIVNAGVLDTLGTNKPAMVFDGTDDFLAKTPNAGLAGTGATTGGITASFSTANRAVWGFGGNVASNRWSFFYNGASILNEHVSTGTTHTPATAVSSDNYYVHGYPAGGDSHSGYMRQNGSALAGGTTGAATAINISGTARLGGLPTGGFFTDATVNMAVLFNAVLAGSDLTELEAELARHVA